MRSSFSSSDRPGNGRYPESMKKTITPSDHRSTSVEYAPVSTSGAMYDVVPQHSSTFWPGSWMIASPKSITLSGDPGSESLYSKFSGLRSRWITRFAWTWSIARTTSTTAIAASRSESPPDRLAIRSKSSPPVHACITMYPNFLSCAASIMCTMLWWRFSRRMIATSFRKSSHSSGAFSRIALSARCFDVVLPRGRHRWTVPKPPSPIGSFSMSHRPAITANLSPGLKSEGSFDVEPPTETSSGVELPPQQSMAKRELRGARESCGAKASAFRCEDVLSSHLARRQL